jgi:hypothetical protein
LALLTLGTATTTTLSAIRWNSALSGVSSNASISDLAALNALMKQQGSRASTTVLPLPTVNQGGLFIPTRGHFRLYEGDYVAVDPVTGEVLVINAASAAGASWVRSA